MNGRYDFLAKLAADFDPDEFISQATGIKAGNKRSNTAELGHFSTHSFDRIFLFSAHRLTTIEFSSVNISGNGPSVVAAAGLRKEHYGDNQPKMGEIHYMLSRRHPESDCRTWAEAYATPLWFAFASPVIICSLGGQKS